METQARVGIGEATGVVGSNAAGGRAYHPTRGRHLEVLWRRLELPPGLGLLDVGCGKGLVLLHAARQSFHRVVGVEYAASLVSVAHQNVARFQARTRSTVPIEVVHADAAAWPIPSDLHVVYVFNPFDEHVFEQVVAQVHASHARTPRPMWLVVNKAQHDAMVLGPGLFKKTGVLHYGSAEMHLFQASPQSL